MDHDCLDVLPVLVPRSRRTAVVGKHSSTAGDGQCADCIQLPPSVRSASSAVQNFNLIANAANAVHILMGYRQHIGESSFTVGAVDGSEALCGAVGNNSGDPCSYMNGGVGKLCPGGYIVAGAALRILKGARRSTVVEYIVFHCGSIALQSHKGQVGTAAECGSLQLSDTLGQGDGYQSSTAPEGVGAHSSNVSTDRHITQQSAAIEGTVSDGSDPIADLNRFNGTTITVPRGSRCAGIVIHCTGTFQAKQAVTDQAPGDILTASALGNSFRRFRGASNGNIIFCRDVDGKSWQLCLRYQRQPHHNTNH